MTIVDVVIKILTKANSPMTTKDIYNAIIKEELYVLVPKILYM